ncbi:MAG: L,D-transpeptidase family protein [Lachnospiraceae bacterium]|nr:L,D-transpeptidase family protein [Lachnospiraceae bacterium]
MKMKATVICAGAAAISILLASTCLENPFQVKADELTNIIDQAYVSTGGAVTPEQTQVTSTPNQTTTVTFKKKNNTVPYSWYKNITAAAVSKDGKSVDVTYKSSNKNVATVDKNGKVRGLQEGTVTITATAKDGSKAKATCKVTVEKEKKGWHKVSDTKKYYVKKDGTRAIGYSKIDGDYYYGKNNSYMLVNQWKYVKVGNIKYKLYFGKNGKQSQNVSSLIGKQDFYKLEVNISKNMVIVYAKDGKNGYIIPVKAMICSCGMPGHGTRQGNYKRLSQAGKWHPLKYGVYGKYCTRYSGPYLFHSVTYTRNGDSYSLQGEEYEKLGKSASHGCIRLTVKDAKWIYNNYSKCEVSIFESNKKAPLKKPVPKDVEQSEDGGYYDPSDKDVK